MSVLPYLVLLLVALAVRAGAACLIGPSPFGPDAPGVEAAAVLGGHPYPLHPWLVHAFGGLRVTSVVLGSLGVLGCARMTERLGGTPWSGGLLAACAPLFVYTSAIDGGDAAALGILALGLALAWSDKPLVGGLICALALAVKPIVLPAAAALCIAPLLSARPGRHLALLLVGVALGLAPFAEVLDPLLRPKPRAGVLGSWFLATGGEVPPFSELGGLLKTSVRVHVGLPTWIGHPLLGGLALLGAVLPGARRRERMVLFAVAGGVMIGTTALLGEATRPRWLAAASLPLVGLAGVTLRRVPWIGLLFAWPALAAADSVATVRAAEDPGTTSPIGLGWPGRIDSTGMFRDASICRASELRGLVEDLDGHSGTLYLLQLRDGREGELMWPLQAVRPGLDIRVVQDDSQAPIVLPGRGVEGCMTEVSHLAPRLDSPAAYGVQGKVYLGTTKIREVHCAVDWDWEGHAPVEQSLGKGEYVTIPGVVRAGDLMFTVKGSRTAGFVIGPDDVRLPFEVEWVEGAWECTFDPA